MTNLPFQAIGDINVEVDRFKISIEVTYQDNHVFVSNNITWPQLISDYEFLPHAQHLVLRRAPIVLGQYFDESNLRIAYQRVRRHLGHPRFEEEVVKSNRFHGNVWLCVVAEPLNVHVPEYATGTRRCLDLA